MTTPISITDLKCVAQIEEEQANGTYVSVQRRIDLRDVFHPLQDANNKVEQTNFRVLMEDGTIKDLNELFEPLASGKPVPIATQFKVNGTDLQQIFAGLNTIPVTLQLKQLPAGAFDCTTRVKIHYDRSG